MMQVVYMVKAMYLASLKLAGTFRVCEEDRKNVVAKMGHGVAPQNSQI